MNKFKYIYLCGPTVYSDVHIGNMRPILNFDIFNRALSNLGKEYFFIHNITDIDDKIIERAQEKNISELELTNKYTKAYIDLLSKANIITPHAMPRVTDNIDLIINYIKKLIESKHAYEKNGNVFFSIESIENYGILSNKKLSKLNFSKENDKKHPADFVLWKKTKKGIKFESPWSFGRPGWHTECAAFISKYAKDNLEIHGGGIDLIFPHHENENAQNVAIYNKNITKKWIHIGQVNINNQKMSKSLGNIINAKDFNDKYSFDVLRYIYLTTSPTSPLNISDDMIMQAVKQVQKIKKSFINALLEGHDDNVDISREARMVTDWNFSLFMKEFYREMKEFNSLNKNNKFVSLLKLIGFSFSNTTIDDEDKIIYKNWKDARANKKFDEADRLRGLLIDKKIL